MSTYTELRNGFRLGPWEVLPDRGLIRNGDSEEHLEPKVIDLLLVLAAHQGKVVRKEQLIESVWEGRAQSDEPLNRCVSVLRNKLGDDSRDPTYIETIPRRGYRLKMAIETPDPQRVDEKTSRWPYWLAWAAGAIAMVVIFALSRIDGRGGVVKVDTPMQSVAVFPFQCPGTTEKYLCFGFSEELTRTLLQAEGIKVVKSRSPYPDQDSHTVVAERLKVDGLLSGSVQRIAEQVRISVELVDGRNGFVILSDSLDGSVDEIFRLQEQVASIIEKSISGRAGMPLRASSEPSSFEAFEAYARGQYQFEIRDKASIEESIDLFQRTIRLDPMFGPAYLRLAYAYLLLPDYDNSITSESMYALATATTEAGITADPSILEPAGTVFGFIHHKRGEWLQATESYETAVTADTVYPISHHWYSRLLASVGRLDDAMGQARLAYELDPDSAIIISRLAIASLWVNDIDSAERYFAVVSKMNLQAPVHDLAAALFLIRKGMFPEAVAHTTSGLAKYGLNSEWVAPVYAGIENPDMRQPAYEIMMQLDADKALPRYILMIIWALLGDYDRAMQNAMAVEEIGQDFELEVLFIEELRGLREKADFPQLLENTGLTEYWDQVGCQWANGRVECT